MSLRHRTDPLTADLDGSKVSILPTTPAIEYYVWALGALEGPEAKRMPQVERGRALGDRGRQGAKPPAGLGLRQSRDVATRVGPWIGIRK